MKRPCYEASFYHGLYLPQVSGANLSQSDKGLILSIYEGGEGHEGKEGQEEKGWNTCLEHAGISFWVFAYFFVDKVVVVGYFGFLVVSLLKACRDMLLGQVLRYLA